MIYRSKTNHNYTVVHNDYLRNPKLSWKAKGLLTYLISLPPDWKIHLQDLRTRSKDSIDATRTAMKELLLYGYAYFQREKDDVGQFISGDYYISDQPVFKGIPIDYPGLENPMEDNSKLENPILLNTILNKYFNIENNEGRDQKEIPNPAPRNDRKCMFKNSEINTAEKFREKVSMPELDSLGVNYEYYFIKIGKWAANKGVKQDWVSFAQSWMLDDYRDKKLVTLKKGSIEYMRGYE